MALDAASGSAPATPQALVLRYADVPLIVVGAIVAIALGAPALGTAVGAITWIVQRIVGVLDQRWARRQREPRKQITISLFERFGRIWLLAAGIVVAALAGHRADGLAAAIVVFCAYTLVFVVKLFSGPPQEQGPS